MRSFLQMFVVCVAVLLQVEAYGQRTTIYHENFSGSVSNIAHNWQAGNTPISESSYSKASKGANLEVPSGASAGTYTLELGPFSAGSFEDIRVSWGGKKSGDQTIKLEYSYNGGVYVPVEGWADVGTAWSRANANTDIYLPTCFNKGKLKLKWTYEKTASSSYAIDDLTITGIPYGGQGITSYTSNFRWATRPLNEVPFSEAQFGSTRYYVQDAVQMQWQKQTYGSGISVNKQNVSSSYKGPTHSFAIEQAKASTTVYSKSTLHFSSSVKGLTFSIYDVDRSENQFLDVVRIVAYRTGNTTPIYPKKEHAQVTSRNEFVLFNGEMMFKSKSADAGGINVPNTSSGDQSSAEADISVTFIEPVDRVEVSYFNAANYGSGASQQGIAIADISWRNTSLPNPEEDITTQSAPAPTEDPEPLPVTLASFTVKKVAEGAKISWTTASEIDNDRFIVERSTDGKTFQPIGEVKGSGNSSTLRAYTFTDRAPANGVNYYRLTQYDFDGKYEVSKAIYLLNSVAPSSIALTTYPNPVPVNEDLTIQASSTSEQAQTLYILNASGSVVKTVVLPKKEASVKVAVGDLPSGLYLLKGSASVSKFYIQ